MGTALVTGANRGLGLELCRQLRARGEHVIAACRSPSADLAALGVQVETGVDVSDGTSVEALAQRLHGVPLDLLVHSAGILRRVTLESLDLELVRRQLETNALGPLRVTAALLRNLPRGAKIAILTSLMGSMADNRSGSHYGYRMSKAAVNAAGVSLARDLAPRGVGVILLHPGHVRTDMTGGTGSLDAEESVRGLLARIDELTVENSGRFVRFSGEELPW
jgi:NAD(P)-dependent dehydrogenase (short-subunit alcohol dehydrogenase family)